jgi:uncharacterized protein with ParB-like and HNH nuclease domain
MSQLLYTVEEVFSANGYLNAHNKKYYNIPLYQRGYKWETASIKKLLQDVYDFQEQDGKFYCLQNITLVPNKDVFNVVDGQQRLTTLTLILSFLGAYKLVEGKVLFPTNSIRTETNNFIKSFITVVYPKIDSSSWPDFISKNAKYDHQDIYYLYQGFQAVAEWFKGHPGAKDQMWHKLRNDVKFIVNNIETAESEEKIFINLNSKRVPLDGADLLRAMIITRAAQELNFGESNIKGIVRINERRLKIGADLDLINQWWGKKKVKDYFRKFIKIRSDETVNGTKLFNDEQYPINLLYLLFSEKCGSELLALEDYEKRSNEMLQFYTELLELHYTMQDWHQDKEIYHYLGFLFTHLSSATFGFKKVWDMWKGSATRTNFIDELRGMIKETIVESDGNLPDFSDITSNWYERNKDKLIRTLILMDITYALREDHANMPSKAFSRTEQDIEHIFPQNPAEVTEKKDYIEFLNNYIVADPKGQFDLSLFDSMLEDDEYKTKVEEFITLHTNAYKTHAIGNLVLLAAKLNRSIKNKPYAHKRSRVVRYYHDGNYIQSHTFNVFTRYINNPDDDNFDLLHWTNLDINANSNSINDKIIEFFSSK